LDEKVLRLSLFLPLSSYTAAPTGDTSKDSFPKSMLLQINDHKEALFSLWLAAYTLYILLFKHSNPNSSFSARIPSGILQPTEFLTTHANPTTQHMQKKSNSFW